MSNPNIPKIPVLGPEDYPGQNARRERREFQKQLLEDNRQQREAEPKFDPATLFKKPEERECFILQAQLQSLNTWLTLYRMAGQDVDDWINNPDRRVAAEKERQEKAAKGGELEPGENTRKHEPDFLDLVNEVIRLRAEIEGLESLHPGIKGRVDAIGQKYLEIYDPLAPADKLVSTVINQENQKRSLIQRSMIDRAMWEMLKAGRARKDPRIKMRSYIGFTIIKLIDKIVFRSSYKAQDKEFQIAKEGYMPLEEKRAQALRSFFEICRVKYGLGSMNDDEMAKYVYENEERINTDTQTDEALSRVKSEYESATQAALDYASNFLVTEIDMDYIASQRKLVDDALEGKTNIRLIHE